MPVVFITGCSSGIGLATALHFARLGYDVHAGARDVAAATGLAGAIAREKLPIRPVAIDVDSESSVNAAVAEVLRRSGHVDVLVNNAGISGRGPIADVPLDWVHQLFETNYFGVFRVTRAVLPGMTRRRSGAIINVGSIAGLTAHAGHGHYCAVKRALEAATEVLAVEMYGLGIRVAIIEPGVIATPIGAKAKWFDDPGSASNIHLRRLRLQFGLQGKNPGQPEDVARVIHQAATTARPKLRYLVGDDARRILAGRQRITDEDFVATGRHTPDEEYLGLLRQLYGLE